MSNWSNSNPERAAEIAALPPGEQNEALREAICYDPDAIRDRMKEEGYKRKPKIHDPDVADHGW